jgi:hypothetical protein
VPSEWAARAARHRRIAEPVLDIHPRDAKPKEKERFTAL